MISRYISLPIIIVCSTMFTFIAYFDDRWWLRCPICYPKVHLTAAKEKQMGNLPGKVRNLPDKVRPINVWNHACAIIGVYKGFVIEPRIRPSLAPPHPTPRLTSNFLPSLPTFRVAQERSICTHVLWTTPIYNQDSNRTTKWTNETLKRDDRTRRSRSIVSTTEWVCVTTERRVLLHCGDPAACKHV